MPWASTLKIAGEQIKPGETRDLHIKFSESYFGFQRILPVRVICAEEEGPKLFLTGAIHGDELAGIGIIRELLFDKPPLLKKGALICVPVVNVFGLENHMRYLSDRRDPNRCFPGYAMGSPSSRLAYVVFREIVQKCDYGLDFHSAAVRRTNYPNVRADMRNPQVKKLARAFGSEIIIDGKGPEGSLRRTAVKKRIPTIILEAGEVWKNEPGVTEIGVRGCLNVMKSLGMIDGEREEPLFQISVKKTTWIRAERGGFLSFYAKPGDLVQEGQTLAINYSIFGSERNNLVSPSNGIVLGMTTMPAVKPGEPVYHIANLHGRTYNSIKKKIQKSDDSELFSRIQEDLSTSVTIQEEE